MKKERLLSLFVKKSAKAEPPPASPYFPYVVSVTHEQQAQYPELTAQIKNFEKSDNENQKLRSKFLSKAAVGPMGHVYEDARWSIRQESGQSGKHLVRGYRWDYSKNWRRKMANLKLLPMTRFEGL